MLMREGKLVAATKESTLQSLEIYQASHRWLEVLRNTELQVAQTDQISKAHQSEIEPQSVTESNQNAFHSWISKYKRSFFNHNLITGDLLTNRENEVEFCRKIAKK